MGDRQWDTPELRKQLENILPNNQYLGYVVVHDFSVIGHRKLCSMPVVSSARLLTRN